MLPVLVFAQKNANTEPVKPALDDCPTWSGKSIQSSKSDYFKYLSKGDDKKTKKTDRENAAVQYRTRSIKKPETIPVQKETSKPIVPGIAEQEEKTTTDKKQETAPVIDKKKEQTTENDSKKSEGDGSAGAEKKEPEKKKENKLKRKLQHIFSKKNNKVAKPNYKKCSTKF